MTAVAALTHHPDDAWLVDYALGNLSELFDGILRAHLGVCQTCRDTISAVESLSGELLRALPGKPSKLSATDITAHYEQQAHSAPLSLSRAVDSGLGNDIEQLVATYLDSSLDALRWRTIGKGLRVCRLADSEDARMWMLRGVAGTVLPVHSHSGSELTLVLKGAYFCGSDIFRAGDIEDADETTEHQPVITRDGECICLAVTEGKLKFRDWIPRFAQPFVGI